MKQTVIVQALLKKDQQVLLLQNAMPETGATLELPGGTVAPGEDPKEKLIRTVVGQLGRAPQVVQLTDVVSYSGVEGQVIGLLFAIALEGQNERLTLDAEHKRYGWYSLSDIQPTQVNKFTQRVLNSLNPEQTEIKRQINEVALTTVAKEVIIYTDGGSRGNPGPSAAGFVVLNMDDERVLFEGGKYLGVTTNNQAEYQAVKLGLEKARELGARVVKFRMDSLLIVNQMLGTYQIKNRDLWPIYASIKEQIKQFDKVTFAHVRREFNRDADALVNKVLDERS